MREHYDVLVIGAGPAGLAAAQTAASHGARVGLLDAQPRPGGQVWRHDVQHPAPRAAQQAIDGLQGVDVLARHSVIATEGTALRVEHPAGSALLSYGSLVLATGARELLLPFPGWTLPGVTGAGGLQALTKQGWPVKGKRVVIGGSGPLLLAAADTLRKHGARVVGIHEQAPSSSVMAFARQLRHWPARAWQAAGLRLRLAGVPYRFGSFVRKAHGDVSLQGVEIDTPHGMESVECDLLAVGYGLVPNTELAQLLGCALDDSHTHACVKVDALLRTSVAQVYAAGEAGGIGGLAVARIEGAMAGHMATGHTTAANALRPQRDSERRFGALLAQHFALDPRLHQLANVLTTVCRCEDVRLGELAGFTDARAAKLATRCGMGACQGRICGTALAELGRFPRSGGRPPLFPARLATLAGLATLPSDDAYRGS
ncbi:NAD(P)/FAD-dependent oxidoreductase [Dyella telluris]|uniref:NAD(P)/FAD-dependent oxidoreductase n=1 Tax=Dyella telluris TaxID=2763498 RepID=A0A7G8Q1J6_9GAMM|nr:FAD/NAD(P)-binding oxidoreductase [Dyella telluris]QNK00654.1 NAD(P)/FAD-dependent oxidoreductase [Dyella telluris]